MYRKIKFWASAFLIFLCLLVILPVVGGIADEGVIRDIWMGVIEIFPFGGMIGEFVIRIVSKALGQYIDMKEYMTGVSELKNVTVLIQELMKLCMSGIFFGVLTAAADTWIKVRKNSGGWAAAERILWHMFCALLSAVLCGLVFQFLQSQLNRLRMPSAKILSEILLFVVISGGIWVYVVLLGSFGKAIVTVVVRHVLLNTLNITISYILILTALLCVSEKLYLLLAGSIGIWGVCTALLIGVDILVLSVLEK